MKMVETKTEMAHLKGLHDELKGKVNELEFNLTKANHLIKGQKKYIQELEDKYINIKVMTQETNVTQRQLDEEYPGRLKEVWCQTLKYTDKDYELVQYVRNKFQTAND